MHVHASSATPSGSRKLHGLLSQLFGAAMPSEQSVVDAVEAGLPIRTISQLIEHGLSRDEVFHIVINPRTYKHRQSKRQPLSREESERAVRAIRVIAAAESVWGEKEKAMHWMRAPKKRFEGRSPIDMLATEPGGRLVEQMLLQIQEGMFA